MEHAPPLPRYTQKPSAPNSSVPPPPPPGGKPIAKRKPLLSSDPDHTSLEPATCKPLIVLPNFDHHFADAVGFSCSESGADGVLFVGWANGGVVVLKANGTIMADAFAYELGCLCSTLACDAVSLMLLDMPFPPMRLYRYQLEAKWQEIYQNIGRLNALRKEREQQGPAKFLERVIYMLMEFVPGRDLFHSNPKELLDGAAGAENLFQIGRIVMFDVFVNNWDRFPLKGVWAHEGNFNNFLFTGDAARPVIGIDQSVQCVNPNGHAPAFEKYYASVERFLNEATGRLTTDRISLNSVREAFVSAVGVDIGEAGIEHFRRGLEKSLHDIVANVTVEKVQVIYNQLDELANKLIAAMIYMADKQYRYGMTNCNVEYFQRMLALFAKYATK